MKKRYVYMLLYIIFVASVMVGCGRREENLLNEDTSRVVVIDSEIFDTLRNNIKQFFEVDMPKEGKVLHQDFSLKDAENGDVYAVVEVSEK